MDFLNKVLDIMVEYTDEGIHAIDRDGRTVLYNEPMAKLEGLREEEVLGKNILDVFPSLTEKTSTLYKALREGKPIINKYQTYLNKRGYRITSINTTIPILDGERILGAIEISKNFTRIKEIYESIIQIIEEGKENKEKKGYTFDSIIGCSPKLLNAIKTAKRASQFQSTVLIYGETGTGKELFAKSIHNKSKRSKGPFIPINCAALPEGLLEGILFGTTKGGFTGAVDRPGLFEEANGGTLLLDEINSMSISLQAKLLRVLQEGYIRRVGDRQDIKIDVRIIATTNEDPIMAIKNGNLRKDLYYRLSVINIRIPPLRERKEDISQYINKFIEEYNNIFMKEVWDVSEEVYDAFMSYDWFGNVRELKNYIEGAMNMVDGHILREEDFKGQVHDTLFGLPNEKSINIDLNYNYQIPMNNYLSQLERKIILSALNECENNISRASELLGIKRQTLQHKIKKFNIY